MKNVLEMKNNIPELLVPAGRASQNAVNITKNFIFSCRQLSQAEIKFALHCKVLNQQQSLTWISTKNECNWVTDGKNKTDIYKKIVKSLNGKCPKPFLKLKYMYGNIDFTFKPESPGDPTYIIDMNIIYHLPARGLSVKLYLLIQYLLARDNSGNNYDTTVQTLHLTPEDEAFFFNKIRNRSKALQLAVDELNQYTDMYITSKYNKQTKQIEIVITQRSFSNAAWQFFDTGDDVNAKDIYAKYRLSDLPQEYKNILTKNTATPDELDDLLKHASKDLKQLRKNRLIGTDVQEAATFLIRRAAEYPHAQDNIVDWYMKPAAQACILKILEKHNYDQKIIEKIYNETKSLNELLSWAQAE